jgi:hypothetical protein
MDGNIFIPSPLSGTRQLPGARARPLDLSSRAVARHSLENRHVLHLIGPFQDPVIVVLWRFESKNFVGRLVMLERATSHRNSEKEQDRIKEKR